MPESHHQSINEQLLKLNELLMDNASPEAQHAIATYYEAKKSGSLTQVHGCSDARAHIGPFTDDAIVFIPSIAAAGDPSLLKHAIVHSGVEKIVVLEHFDGSTVTREQPPTGCGGLGVKAERLKNGTATAHAGVYRYVDTHISHPDIYGQSIVSAASIAQYTDKPVFAGAIDHITGLIYIFGILGDRGSSVRLSVPFIHKDDPQFVYRDGTIPIVHLTDNDTDIKDLLQKNKSRVAELSKDNPHLDEEQRIQNPRAVIITTSLIPTHVRYPHTFGFPNTNFGIFLPFEKDSDGSVTDVPPRALQHALEQTQYALTNAVEAQIPGGHGHGFFDTHRIVIETPDLDLSKRIAQKLYAMEPTPRWLRLANNEIWYAQVTKGITKNLEVFRP